MSRSQRSALTLGLLVLLLLAGAVVGWRTLTAPLPDDEPTGVAQEGCEDRFRPGDVVRAGDVTVSVFNAGTRSGLADRTLQELSSRGFISGEVGNAPGRLADVRRVAVLAPTAEDPAARLVARQFGRRVQVRPSDQQLGPGVEVVVGDRFNGLVRAPQRLRADAAGSGC